MVKTTPPIRRVVCYQASTAKSRLLKQANSEATPKGSVYKYNKRPGGYVQLCNDVIDQGRQKYKQISAAPMNCTEHHSPTEIKDTHPADLIWRETALVPYQENGPPLQEVTVKLKSNHTSTTSKEYNDVLGLPDLFTCELKLYCKCPGTILGSTGLAENNPSNILSRHNHPKSSRCIWGQLYPSKLPVNTKPTQMLKSNKELLTTIFLARPYYKMRSGN
jgi:hypothetical protein